MILACCCFMMSSFTMVHAEEATEAQTEAQTEEAPKSDFQKMMEDFMNSITGDYEYEETEVTCERDGKVMRGILAMPKMPEGEKPPVVILSHGFTSSKGEMTSLAKGYAVNGIASVRFDFLGSGESDGDSTDMSVRTEVEDLNAILDYVKTLDEVDTDHIVLSGNSMGGLVTALTGAQREDDVDALVLNYPAFSIPDDNRSGRVQDIEFDVNDVPETITLRNYTIGARYITDTLDMDPYEEACGFSKDVLIFHGDADEIVNISYSEKAAELYPSAELVVVEGGGHGFWGDPMLDEINRSVEFVKAETAE